MPVASLLELDLSRPLNQKERASAIARVGRLDGPLWTSISHARDSIDKVGGRPERLLDNGFRVRRPFVFQNLDHGSADASDRRVLARKDRPPLTRIMSSQGATLRLELAALALGQMRYQGGRRRPALDLPIWGYAGQDSWADMIATEAERTRTTKGHYVEKDKRARSVSGSLQTLVRAGLVSVDRVGAKNVVTFLHESGSEDAGGTVPYETPRASEATVTLPGGFVTNGWLHVLEDSEIAVLFMVACRLGGFADDLGYAIPGPVRLLNYGISRESYSKALKTLSWFGLVVVQEVGRHEDGRSVDFGVEEPQLHRLNLRPEGLALDGPSQVRRVLQEQLDRL